MARKSLNSPLFSWRPLSRVTDWPSLMTRRLPLSRILNGLYGEIVLAVITRPEKLSQVTLPNDFVMKVQFVTLEPGALGLCNEPGLSWAFHQIMRREGNNLNSNN